MAADVLSEFRISQARKQPPEMIPNRTGVLQAGSKIVDLCELAKQLRCRQCSSLLDLNNVMYESAIGFACHLTVLCFCGQFNDIYTSKVVRYDNGKPVLDNNVKILERIGKFKLSVITVIVCEKKELNGA